MNIHSGATHQVLNQARPATGWNAFSSDAVLQGIVARGSPWVADNAVALGAYAGDADTQELARLANRCGPELRTHDRFGHRIDWVDFHPAWHELMALAFQHQVHSLAWTTKETNGHLGMARSACPYIIGYGSSPSRCGPPNANNAAKHETFASDAIHFHVIWP
jgi:putative acyl-CoA dehydrogenase